MAEFTINDEELVGVKGKVVVLTGSSSGIGLATVNLLLSLGASVVAGDINDPAETPAGLTFLKTNVSQWADLAALFKKAIEVHGHIDYVFANAGIGPRANYLELETDANGDLKAPNSEAVDVMLTGVINTASLGFHYMKAKPEGCAIVLMSSSTGLQPLRAPDYSTAKHGVIGFGRGFARLLEAASIPIRVNTLTPSWTSTNVLPNVAGIMQAVSHRSQSPDVIARLTAFLFVDGKRHGDIIFVDDGKYSEIEKSILVPALDKIKGDAPADDEILRRIVALSG